MGWKDKAKELIKDKEAQGPFKLQVGDNTFRVLPTKAKGKDKEPAVFHLHNVHYGVGPQSRTVTCGVNYNGEGECWLDDTIIPKLLKSDSKASKKKAEGMERREAAILQIAKVDPETEKMRGPKFFFPSTGGKDSLFTRIMKTLRNPKKECLDVKKGHNLYVEKTGEGMKTRYGTVIIEDEPTEVPESIIKKMKTFEEIVKPYSEEAQKAAYYGRDEEDDDDNDEEEEDELKDEELEDDELDEDEEDEKPKKKKKKPVDEDEDKEEDDDSESDDEEESEDEDEEEEPVRKKKKKKPVEEDEEDEEDSDDDDEDEPPAKKKKIVKKKKPKDEDEEDESDSDDEDESEDEEEEEERPKKKAKKKVVEEDEEEESEDEDDDSDSDSDEDEDEEEESPKRNKKVVKKVIKKKRR